MSEYYYLKTIIGRTVQVFFEDWYREIVPIPPPEMELVFKEKWTA